MLQWTRTCDTCGETIPPASTYYEGRTTAEAAAPLLDAEDARLVPTFAQEADGEVVFDLCGDCVAVSENLHVLARPRRNGTRFSEACSKSHYRKLG